MGRAVGAAGKKVKLRPHTHTSRISVVVRILAHVNYKASAHMDIWEALEEWSRINSDLHVALQISPGVYNGKIDASILESYRIPNAPFKVPIKAKLAERGVALVTFLVFNKYGHYVHTCKCPRPAADPMLCD